jgi:hypothetical protein
MAISGKYGEITIPNELKKAYEETLKFLQDEGREIPLYDLIGGQGRDGYPLHDGAEEFLQKDRLLGIFKSL